jgi:hypothetical protein
MVVKRGTQIVLICQSCGFTTSADLNVALFIKKMGGKAMLNGTIVV